MTLEIEGVPAERLPELERQVVLELERLLDLPADLKGLTLEQLLDQEALRNTHYDEVVELSRKFPNVRFRLFAYGDCNGGWPWVDWLQNGELLCSWQSDEQIPDEMPRLEGQEPAGAIAELLTAARAVLANWEQGDLAGAVRGLDAAIAEAETRGLGS